MLKTKSLKPTLFTQRFPSGKNGSRNGAAISKRSTNKVTSILKPNPASTAISFKKFDEFLRPVFIHARFLDQQIKNNAAHQQQWNHECELNDIVHSEDACDFYVP